MIDGLHSGPRDTAQIHSIPDKTRAAVWAQLFVSPPQRVSLSFDRGPRRSLHYSSNHASTERFSAISFSSGRCTLSDWLSVHEGPW